jgi:hypothetical protein
MSDLNNDMQGGEGERRCVFDESASVFWLERDSDTWFSLREGALRREMKARGLRDKPMAVNGETISQLDAEVRRVEQQERVSRALFVAGYRPGIHEIGGERILVTRRTPLLVPKKGEWPLLQEVFRRMFVGPAETVAGSSTIDQRDHWFAWLQDMLRSLYDGRISRGLWLHIAGEPNSGKTLTRDIAVAITGGRMGKPYKWMIDKEEFNRDMFGSVLQVMDDDNADTRIEARKNLGAKGKQIVADGAIYLRAMFNDGFVFKPMWRLMTLTNIEAEALLVMPPITNDIADKILMLKAYQASRDGLKEGDAWPMPMPTNTPAQRDAFWKALEAEFPAFVFWLLEEFAAPSHVVGERFGVRAWQHPEILKELQQFSPHVRLWQLIEASGVVFVRVVQDGDDSGTRITEPTTEWEGTAGQLHELLGGPGSKLSMEERRKLPDPSWLGQRLRALEREWGAQVVEQRRTGKERKWRLHRRTDLAQ